MMVEVAIFAVAGFIVAGAGFVIGLFDGAAAGAAIVARRWLELHPEDAEVRLDRRHGRRPAAVRDLVD